MTIIGYVFLVLSLLIYFGIIGFLFNKDSSKSGSAYFRSMIFLHFALFIGLAIVTGIIGSKGGFAWVSPPRFLLLGAGLLLSIVGSCLAALFKIESGPGMSIPMLLGHAFPILIPLLLLCSGAILLNDQWRSGINAAFYQQTLILAAVLGSLGIVVFVITLIVQERSNA